MKSLGPIDLASQATSPFSLVIAGWAGCITWYYSLLVAAIASGVCLCDGILPSISYYGCMLVVWVGLTFFKNKEGRINKVLLIINID